MSLLITLLFACNTAPEEKPKPAPTPPPAVTAKAGIDKGALRTQAKAMFGALPKLAPGARTKATAEIVALGKQLYFDTRLSSDDTISCNSCHQLDNHGVDSLPTSPGVGGQLGGRNSPTVLNAALHQTQFWDGRSKDVEAQALGPILNPIEMAMPDEASVVKKLSAIDGYKKAFAGSFQDGLTYANIGEAIGAFERTLVTPAPLDAFLAGDDAAMTEPQLAGMKTFMETGCTTCHMGPAVGGQGFFKLGQVKPYEDDDKGREEVTKNEADRQMFKPPGLRNVVHTGPYFHNGKIKTLDEAVTLMARHQLGKELEEGQVKEIVTFLGALTGELPEGAATPPKLP